jgi:hypothetical protein
VLVLVLGMIMDMSMSMVMVVLVLVRPVSSSHPVDCIYGYLLSIHTMVLDCRCYPLSLNDSLVHHPHQLVHPPQPRSELDHHLVIHVRHREPAS